MRNNSLSSAVVLSWSAAFTVAVIVFLCISHAAIATERRPLMRFPDVHENTIVFVYGEDIWSVPTGGGTAERLTIHDGDERFPKISPDGTMIAFTGEYDGNGDIYVMNLHGGDIRRVTYHPGYDTVLGWHPTKNKILFRSTRASFNRFNRLFLISPDGTDLEELILNEASLGSFSEDGSKIAYNKVSREFRTWKRYQGGTAQDIYLFNFETNENNRLTDYPGTDRLPMWIGDKIYFSSDRDRTLNIYSYDLNTKSIEKITNHDEYDIRRPSKGGDKIVYELGGSIWLLDTVTRTTHQVPIEIKTDLPEIRPYLKKVDEYITGVDCSPSGERALIVARGEVFTVPAEEGPTRDITKDSGARDKDAAWSPDGTKIAYLSDREGEYEIYLVDPMGKSEAVRLTKNDSGYRHTLRWSPDSRKIAFADQTLRCYYLDVESKKVTEVDRARYENVDVSLDLKPIYDFSWSPDSRYIAYSKMDQDQVYQIYIYSLETGKIRCVSEGLFNDFGPVFSRDGEYLFFVSNRRFDPTFGDFEWEMVYKKMAGIYCLTLREDGDPLLPFESDEVELDGGDKKAKEDSESRGKIDKKEKNGDKPPRVRIDYDGITGRIEALPLPRGNYRNLAVNESGLFYLNKDEGDFNRFEFRAMGARDLYRYSFEDREEESVITGIDSYDLSADGSKIVYKKQDTVGIIDSNVAGSEGGTLDLSDLKMWFDPLAEWTQIFNEAWRLERDFFYDPNMHGIDWNAMKEKYGRLLPDVSCRQDIRYLIGELIGELNTSHTYIFGGDRKREAEEVNVGMLGVDWEIDRTPNRYRFGKIYRVPEWTREIMPPLLKPGIHIEEGDYLLAVNGEDVIADRNIYSYFIDLAGKQVTLLVSSKPTGKDAREYTVKPLRGEFTLRYLDWVEHNRLVADEVSGGSIGYLHFPDTYTGSARIFPKYFYSQTRKKGLIIDGRFNGGGLDPDIFLERLNKDILAYWTRRYSHDQTTPAVATRAHMVCLTNRQAGSGGDMLPWEFQQLGMGPVIGTRSWGGLVGLSAFIRLIDGGGLSAPDYRIYDPKGKWVVENVGVEPDIIVDLDPVEMSRGEDAQLRTAIDVLMKKIEEEPRPWPEHEPFEIDE